MLLLSGLENNRQIINQDQEVKNNFLDLILSLALLLAKPKDGVSVFGESKDNNDKINNNKLK